MLLKKIFLMLCCFGTIFGEETPKYLYKVLSIENWKASKNNVKLSKDDSAFIHFSTEDQLERIISKYWAQSDYVVLKIDTKKLPGKMVYEANPGGQNKYFHLYDGFIPLDAVVDVKEVKRKR